MAGDSPREKLNARLDALRERLPEIDAATAAERLAHGALLLDVREPDETAEGHPRGATLVPRGQIELRAQQLIPDTDQPVLMMCAGGTRSLMAAGSLADLGYRNVTNVAGGFNAWKAAGLPVERPATGATDSLARYHRQTNLPEVGEAGQRRLNAASVLLVGAGGLGAPAALYLAGAGVGRLGIVDDDVVELSNLHRQVLHTEANVGLPKALSAQSELRARNSAIRVETHVHRLNADNVAELIAGYDVVVDGSDNFATRYVLSDACAAAGIPLVHGSIFRFEGQVTVLDPAAGGPCYRCLFPEPPPAELAPSCSEAGVLGVLPGTIGLIQATETLKLLLGIGEPLTGALLCVDTLHNGYRRLQVAPREGCPGCVGIRKKAQQA